MNDEKPNAEADINEAEDRGESVTRMEPLLVREGARARGELADFALDLTPRSTAFRAGLPDDVADSLATLVRAINCNLSNLIYSG